MKPLRIILSAAAMVIALVGAFTTKASVSLANVFTKGSGTCQVSATCTTGSGISCSSTAYASLADCQNNRNAVQARKK